RSLRRPADRGAARAGRGAGGRAHQPQFRDPVQAGKIMRKYFKRLFYLVALLSLSLAHAGSYEDFFRAIKQDDAGTVNQLLRRGFDANALDPSRNHGLFLAVRDGSLKAAAVLIA